MLKQFRDYKKFIDMTGKPIVFEKAEKQEDIMLYVENQMQ